MSKKFSGAGILLLEMHNKNPCVILFAKNNSAYHDLGGAIDAIDKKNKFAVELTAMRESCEESSDVIHIKNINIFNKLPFVDLEDFGEYYRCYIMYICQQFPDEIYYENVNILKKLSHTEIIPHQWKETNMITRVSLQQIMYTKKLKTLQTLNNKEIAISPRTQKVLNVFRDSMPKLTCNNWKLKKDNQQWNTTSVVIN